MCALSKVMDHYGPIIPNPAMPTDLSAPIDWSTIFPQSIDLAELRNLIADFKQAVEAAKKADALTAQPDCVDPEKQKLEERVARLERVIDALLAGRAP